MYLSRAFGRTLFAAAARSRTYASSAGAATASGGGGGGSGSGNGGGEGHNPLQEFFEADRTPDNDTPVVYGIHFCHSFSLYIDVFGSAFE